MKSNNIIMISIALLLMISIFSFSIKGDVWTNEIIDSSTNTGLDSSMAIDSNNNPHIAYFDMSNYALKYAKWNGINWDIQTVEAEGDSGSVGWEPSIAIDSHDYPHITYIDYGNDSLKYAKWNGTDWEFSLIGILGDQVSIALDSNDAPHIVFRGDARWRVNYATLNNSNWDHQELNFNGNGIKYPSIALDSKDQIHITFKDVYKETLEYLVWTGSDWHYETIDNQGTVGDYSSIKIDSNDVPHICYSWYYGAYGSQDRSIRYARWTSDDWYIETVDNEGIVGEGACLALDYFDTPHISYIDDTKDNIKYASWINDHWTIESIDNIGPFFSTSICIGSNNIGYISYYSSDDSTIHLTKKLLNVSSSNGQPYGGTITEDLIQETIESLDEAFIVYSSINKTYNLDYWDYDVYEIHSNGTLVELSVNVIYGSNIDIYVFTEGQLEMYERGTFGGFVVTWDAEDVMGGNWQTSSNITYYLVVENMMISDTGANPLNNVTYEITVDYVDPSSITDSNMENDTVSKIKTWILDNICYSVCGILILMAITTSIWLFMKPKQSINQQETELTQKEVDK